MHDLPVAQAAQFGVFTAAQAMACGWTSHALRHAVATGRLRRVRLGVYAPQLPSTGNRFADAETRLRMDAAALALNVPALAISHAAAASMFGLALVSVPTHVCATTVRGRRGEASGVHLHRAASLTGCVVRRGPFLMTSAARTVVDLGREQGADACVAAADSAARLGLAPPAELQAALEQAAGWPGVTAARGALVSVDPRAESVLESLSRLRMTAAGLPPPVTQAEICDVSGRASARCDFYWPDVGVVGEADGFGKYGLSESALRHEKIRQGLLEDLGLIVVRWGWSDLDPFEPTAARLRAAFARGRRPDRAPRLWQVRPRPTWYPDRAAG